jgi:hypothetical protein
MLTTAIAPPAANMRTFARIEVFMATAHFANDVPGRRVVATQ